MNCPVCQLGLDEAEEINYFNTKFAMDSTFNGLKVIGCISCKFSFVLNPPTQEQLNLFYNQVYRSLSSPYHINFFTKKHLGLDARSFSQVSLAANLTDFQPGDTFLDLGPGKGYSFEQAQLLLPNPKLASIEYSKEALNYYNRHFEIDNFESLVDFGRTGRQAKILLMSHSLEHFSYLDLPDLLSSIKAVLAPGGVGIVEVPHANLLTHRAYLDNDSPHLLFFSRSSLAELFETHGFEIVSEGLVGSNIQKKVAVQTLKGNKSYRTRQFFSRVLCRLARVSNPDKGNLEIVNQTDFLLNFGRNPEANCIRIAVKPK